MGIKKMIVRCGRRRRRGACSTCENRKVCPSAKWDSALASANDGSAPASRSQDTRALLRSVARLLAHELRPRRTFAHQVEQALVPLLSTNEATAACVADRLGLSRQTLYRRLRTEGTSFKELLSTKRRQLAIHYLGIERVPVKVAAWRLGFRSPEAFSRAFKRWTGTSPGRFQSSGA